MVTRQAKKRRRSLPRLVETTISQPQLSHLPLLDDGILCAESAPNIMARDFYEALGQRIRTTRERAEWTQRQLAEAIRIDTATLSRYETGRKAISLEVLRRISSVFRVSLRELIDVEGTVPVTKPAIPAPKVKAPVTTDQDELAMLQLWRELPPYERQLSVKLMLTMRQQNVEGKIRRMVDSVREVVVVTKPEAHRRTRKPTRGDS